MTRDDIENVLSALEGRGYIRLGRITGQWHQVYCPFHSDGTEKKPSCGVLLEDQVKAGAVYKAGMFNCFACHSTYDLAKGVDQIFKIKGSTESSKEWLSSIVKDFNVQSTYDDLIPKETMVPILDKFAAESLKIRLQGNQKFVQESELCQYRFIVPYMYQRKLTDAVIEKYDIGYDANHIPAGRSKPLPCITFPVHDSTGNVLFICRRSIQGKYYNYPEGVTKPVYGVYQLPKNCSSVMVCESIINALTLVSWGYNAVALFGTGNTYQVNQLKKLGVTEFILCLDGDDAGRRGAKKLKQQLMTSSLVWTVNMLDGKDVNDLTKEEFDELLHQKE